MKHLSFLRRHANIVFCLLLCLVYQRAESKELFENNSLDTCYVLAIANVDLTTDLQKKYEERNIATSAIVGYSFSDDEVKIYLLDDRYDFDLYSIQKGDSITLHYPHTSQEKEKKAIAIHNHSFQERIRKNDSIYIDIDFWNIEKKLSLPPSLDVGTGGRCVPPGSHREKAGTAVVPPYKSHDPESGEIRQTGRPVRYVRDDTRGQRDRQGVGGADHP